MNCPNCGISVRRNSYCAACGAQAGSGPFCMQCGERLGGPNFCPHCGASLDLLLSPVSDPLFTPAALATGDTSVARPSKLAKPRVHWSLRLLKISMILGAALLALVMLAAAEGSVSTLLIATIAAVVPAILYVIAILSLDRYEHEPLRAVAYAFAWGATGAVIFSVIAEALFAGFATVAAGAEAAGALTLVVGAPVIEEAFKGVALLILLKSYRHELDNVLDGLVYGAIIGIGFAMTENIGYFIQAWQEGGFGNLGELFIIRAVVNGFGHAMYTGVIGAAVGWSRSQYQQGAMRWVVPVLGYLAGVLLHMLWNGGVVLLAELLGEDASIWQVMLVEAPLFVLPPLLILYLVARRGASTERWVMKQQLHDEVAAGVISEPEYFEFIDHDLRSQRLRSARKQGWNAWKLQRRFYETAGNLAYLKYHQSRGEVATPQTQLAIASSRRDLQVLRSQLSDRTA